MINFVLSISFQMNKEIRTLRLPALGSDFYCLVRLKGLEPPRRRHQILSLARLPISPQPQNNTYIFYHIRFKLSTEKVFLFLYYY